MKAIVGGFVVGIWLNRWTRLWFRSRFLQRTQYFPIGQCTFVNAQTTKGSRGRQSQREKRSRTALYGGVHFHNECRNECTSEITDLRSNPATLCRPCVDPLKATQSTLRIARQAPQPCRREVHDTIAVDQLDLRAECQEYGRRPERRKRRSRK
jgi:hypothetical protein